MLKNLTKTYQLLIVIFSQTLYMQTRFMFIRVMIYFRLINLQITLNLNTHACTQMNLAEDKNTHQNNKKFRAKPRAKPSPL